MGSRLESNSAAVRKRIEKHKFADEEGEEYGGSKFGGFTDYFRRKKIKLQNLDAEVGVPAHVLIWYEVANATYFSFDPPPRTNPQSSVVLSRTSTATRNHR